MKKLIFSFLLLISIQLLYGQDTIVAVNGEEIPCHMHLIPL